MRGEVSVLVVAVVVAVTVEKRAPIQFAQLNKPAFHVQFATACQ